MLIKALFHPSKDIYRTIEKVITYNASQEERLKAEITEYFVTEHIDEQFEELLTKMQLAMDQGGQNDVGVWVSGFYGSGKSSFTKYLGLALDDQVKVDGVPFLRYLQDRMNKPQTKALLNTLATRYPAAVVLLDLASEMLAGATMEDVSTVLYYKVLQWAGYSQNLKVAAFERRLHKDGRYNDFTARIEQEAGVAWLEVQNDPLVIDSLLPEIAHELYPNLFKSTTAFNTETADIIRFETDRVQEMIDIVRETTGKQFIIFIIDEVGQYVGSRPNLILNLDGLAKNLKNIGDGKVWIIGTAQQTLTEDDPRAALNSPELFKLTARFPIQIDLQANDIKVICTNRLLGKSPTGEATLGTLFDKQGQALRYNTKLQDARFYDSDFDRKLFINLYPFLPAHFDILLHLLGALAKSTGGIGLRSAIKVVQDILVEGSEQHTPVANRAVGWLATTVTLYDSLEKDIRRAFPSIHKAVGKVTGIRFPDSPIHQEVAKTVAVLQILSNMPVTVQNVGSLLHGAIDAPSHRDAVEAAVKDLISDAIVPFGEKDGNLCFFSEKLNEIDQERAQIPLRTLETRRLQNEALREAFSPLPATRLHNSLTIAAGLKVTAGAQLASLAGDRETIQLVVDFADPSDYETVRTRLVEESRQRNAQHLIYLLGRTAPEIDEKVGDIYRCNTIVERYRNDPDQEVKEYCAGQIDRATKLTRELQFLLKRSLGQGSFLFRGQITATDSLDHDVYQAAKKQLDQVAGQVFDRYSEAPLRADTALAEKFLRVGNLRGITVALDPLGLVQINSGTPSVKSDHKALISLRDYIDRQGTVEGKRLIDYFTDAPFGWSQDTLRYLIAALLVAGEITLRVSGREVTVNGQQAVEALRTNNSFRLVGVALRGGKPPLAVLARAANRLTELTGEQIIPLEDEISKAAAKHFPQCQFRFGPLSEKLDTLGLPGVDLVRTLNQELANILLTDASDAPQRLGGEESALYENLKWSAQVEVALRNGLEATVRDLQQHCREIMALPATGAPGQLQHDLAEDLELVQQRLGQASFYQHAADLRSTLTMIQARTRDAAIQMAGAQKVSIQEAQADLQRLPTWSELNQEEQAQVLGQLDTLAVAVAPNLAGLKQLLNQEYTIQSRLSEVKRSIEQRGRERQLEREREENERQRKEKERALREGRKCLTRTVELPAMVKSIAEMEAAISELQAVRSELDLYDELEITLQVG